MAQPLKFSALFGNQPSNTEAAQRCVTNRRSNHVRNPRRRSPSEANAPARPAAASRRRPQHRRLPQIPALRQGSVIFLEDTKIKALARLENKISAGTAIACRLFYFAI